MTELEIINPATGNSISKVPVDTKATLTAKFEKARKAQRFWAKSSIDERIEKMQRFKELILSQLDVLARDLTLETGKPVSQSKGEVKSVTSRIDFFIQNASSVLAPLTVSKEQASTDEVIEYEPLGVIANISAWNYPYFVGLNVLVPALLAGNAIIYKPSEYATLTGLHIVRLLKEAGFPEDLIAAAIGNSGVGEYVLGLDIEGLFFTGSYATGQKILATIGPRMMKVQLELGGKDGIYVCEDANLKYAVASIAEGAFYNTGQGCCSVERIFVHTAIYDRFKRAFIDEVGSYKIGDPLDETTFIGPLTRPQHIAFLQGQVDDATSHGAQTILGGNRLEGAGSFFAPTILECTGSNSRILTEESFGPIVAIQSVSGDEEAVLKLNATQYGLTAGVYTPNKNRAVSILTDVKVGSAYWNCCDRVSPYLPWSGRKSSGVGVTLSTEGIRCFTHSKAWHLRTEPRP